MSYKFQELKLDFDKENQTMTISIEKQGQKNEMVLSLTDAAKFGLKMAEGIVDAILPPLPIDKIKDGAKEAYEQKVEIQKHKESGYKQ